MPFALAPSSPFRAPRALVFAGSVLLGPLVSGSLLPLLFVALTLLFFDRRRSVAFLLLLGGLLGKTRGESALAAYRAREAQAREGFLHPARCAGHGVVDLPGTERGGASRFVVEVAAGAECEDRLLDFPFRAALTSDQRLPLVGESVSFVADLARPETFANLGLGDADARAARREFAVSGTALDLAPWEPKPWSARRGVLALIDRARRATRRVIHRDYGPKTEGLARALVLGENDLDEDDQDAFRASGLSHLLAVSGTHLVFAVGFLVKGLERVLLAFEALALRVDVRRVAAGLAIPLTWLYCIFAGGSGSAVRASWMLSVALLARAFDARPRAGRAFALSIALGSAVDPLVVYDVSFILSISATAGLFAVTPLLLESKLALLPKLVATPLAATLGATVACFPFVLPLAETQGLLGPLANLLAAPLGEWCALPPSLLHPVLDGIGLDLLARVAARVADGALFAVREIALVSAKSRIAAGPPLLGGEYALLGACVIALFARTNLRARLSFVALTVLLVGITEAAFRAPSGRLVVEVFDVGQGDATLVRLPDGTSMLIDAGGIVGSPVDVGERVVRAALRRARIHSLRAAVLSHPHPDHYGGMPSALRDVDVPAFWDTGQGESEGARGTYADLLGDLRSRGALIERPGSLCGERWLAGVRVEVLAPCPSFDSAESPNDNSLVIRFTFGTTCALFVGDAERHEEARLAPALNPCEVLKVGHHGSRTSSSPEFLTALRPRYAVISSGVRNRFGHPHPVTTGALSARGIEILRTDTEGSARLTSDGEAWKVETARSPSSTASLYGWLE